MAHTVEEVEAVLNSGTIRMTMVSRRAMGALGAMTALGLLMTPAQAQDDTISVNKAAAETRTAPDTISAIASSYGDQIAAGLQDGRLAIWKQAPSTGPVTLVNPTPTKVISAHKKRINDVTFSPDAAFVATASNDGHIAVWKTDTFERADHFADSSGPKPVTLSFSSDDLALAAGYDDGTVKIWSLNSPQPVQTFKAHKKKVLAVTFARGDDSTVFSVGEDKMLDTWNVSTGEQVTQVNLRIGHENDDNFRDLRYRSAAVAHDAKRIAIAASVSHVVGNYAGIVDEHYVKIINTTTGAKTSVIADNIKSIGENSGSAVALSDDGMLLATVGQTAKDATTVMILNAKTKDRIGELQLPSRVQALQFGWRQSGWQIVVADGKSVTSFPIVVGKDATQVPTDALAVTVPTEKDADKGTVNLCKATADTMQDAAVGTGRFVVVNRNNLNEVMDEMALSRTGLVDKNTRLKMGKLVNARRFLVAKIVPVASSYHVTIWMEAVETGKVLASKDGDASSTEEVLTLAHSLASGVLRSAQSEDLAAATFLIRRRPNALMRIASNPAAYWWRCHTGAIRREDWLRCR